MEDLWIDRNSYMALKGREPGPDHSRKQCGNPVTLNFIAAIPLVRMTHTETLAVCEPGDAHRNVHSNVVCNNQKKWERPNIGHSEGWIHKLHRNTPNNT